MAPSQLPLVPVSAGRKTDEHHHQLTPEPKRRRMTNGTYGPPHPHVGTPVVTAYPPSAPHFRDSFGHSDASMMRHVQPSPQSMGPPPRPYQPPSQSQTQLRGGPILTPIGTHNTADQQPSAPPPPPPRMQPTTFLTRLTLLQRISPPFSYPKPAIATEADGSVPIPPRKRGALVSFEGDDPEAVTQAVNWLGEFLCRSDEYKVRTASGPRVLSPGENVSIVDYLDLIRDWHDKSREMIELITSTGGSEEIVPTTEAHDETHALDNTDHDNTIDLTNGTNATATSPPKPNIPAPSSPPRTSTTLPSSTADNTPPTAIPLILLRRYQLHASNTFAQHIPLGPTYTPIDHWQWMATLWRGTLGPDLTVYIKDYDDASFASGGGLASHASLANHASLGNGGNGGNGSVNVNVNGGFGNVNTNMHDLLTRNKGVEVMQERNLVVVWKRKGVHVEEAALRRVAFEVGEGVRGVWEGGGR